MEYKQSYDNDLDILKKQINKVLLEKTYSEHIEPYKDSPALVKMIYKKNEHLFDKYKDIPELSLNTKNLFNSLNQNQIKSILNALNIIKDPNEIKNLVNPSQDYFYKEAMKIDESNPSTLDIFANKIMNGINDGKQRIAIKYVIVEMAEKSYPNIIKEIYPNTTSKNANEHFSNNYNNLLSEEETYSGKMNTDMISPRAKKIMGLIDEQLKNPLGAKVCNIKDILNNKNLNEVDIQSKNKIK